MSPILFLHISGAVIGLLSGAMAVVFRKGSGWHAAAGNVFFVSMLCMSSSAAYVAVFERPNRVNLMMGILTFYLVSTAWVAAKRRDGKPGLFDRIALLVVLADGLAGIAWGFKAAATATRSLDKMPAPFYFVFGTIALLCAVADVRMIARGGYTGARRIARHLWRMCFPLWIAGMSLYPGQAKLFSKALRDTNLLTVPQWLLAVFTIYSLVRVLRSRAGRRKEAVLNAATEVKAAA
jgi:uncharacterized membrane protein